MMDTLFLPLVYNGALLLALAQIHSITTNQTRQLPSGQKQALHSLLLSLTVLAIMALPIQFAPGIVFDTRSVLLALAGLFIGPIPTLAAMLSAGSYRIFQGGAGVVMGTSVILASGLIGILWRHWRYRNADSLHRISVRELVLFGLVVHLVMFGLIMALPTSNRLQAAQQVGPLILTLYPLITLAVGLVLRQHWVRQRLLHSLQESQAYNRLLFDSSRTALVILDPDSHRFIDCNPAAVRIYRLSSREQVLQLTPADVSAPTQPDGKDSATAASIHIAAALTLGEDAFVWRHRRPDGSEWDADVHLMRFEHDKRVLLQFSLQDITEKLAAKEALLQSEAEFRSLANSGRALIWTAGLDMGCNYFNQTWLAFTGRTLEQELGDGWAQGVHPDDYQRCLNTYVTAFQQREKFSMVYRLRRHDGEYRWILDDGSPRHDAHGNFIGYIGHCLDITDLHTAESNLRLYQQLFANTSEGIFITDTQGTIITINDAFRRITGYGETEAIGQTPRLLNSGRQNKGFYQQLWQQLIDAGQWRGEIWNRRKDGEVYPEWLTITTIHDEQQQARYYAAIFSDITHTKEVQEKLYHQAHHDALTNLPNRLLLQDRLTQMIAHCKREQQHLAVMFLDLDRFKNINDTLGHSVGDELLIQVAARLQQQLRHSDTLARIGGDEFVMLIDRVQHEHDLAPVAHKLQQALHAPFHIQQHELIITSSIGISLYPQDGDDVESLLKHADAAMYQAKALGRNTYRFFTPSIAEGVYERLLLENELRGALARQELHLHYQLQVDMTSGQPVGAEALIRWQHPRLGMVAPNDFIPLAEEIGLIYDIGLWVIQQTCQQLRHWHTQGIYLQEISANLSVQQLSHDRLADDIARLLQQVDDCGSRLILEITESTLMTEPEQSLRLLNRLQSMGIRLAIDDFGTGYSSLAYLKHLPLHALKIDKSFVDDIGQDPSDENIIHTIIALANTLGLKTIAEGVETAQQASFLRQAGATLGQGYLYSRPVPPDAFATRWQALSQPAIL